MWFDPKSHPISTSNVAETGSAIMVVLMGKKITYNFKTTGQILTEFYVAMYLR